MKNFIQVYIFCGLILFGGAAHSQNDTSISEADEFSESSSTCDDQIQNGTETGIDCGGESCEPCNPRGIVDPLKRTSVAVYPNPSSGPFKFQSNVGEIESIELFSASGQLLFISGSFNKKDASIDLTSLESQTLYARVSVNGTIIQKTLIKQ